MQVAVCIVQENVNLDYNLMEWSNKTQGKTSSVGCITQYPHNFLNRTTHEYGPTLSVGHSLFILGFIGILVVLKSLLTKITMVENRPDDSEYAMSMCELPTTYKITIQRRVSAVYTKRDVTATPPNSPCLGQTLSMSLIGSPVSCSGNQCYGLSKHDRERLYYGARCLFSSPDGSAKSLV
ncbi:uncharacterized protein LOC120928699 isoform X2 [Rana temporaria]|uniref:uncharacterized protein LOC120928699 isoform X2 n=1 Tax=Rana temporaria TaxID=8407 RepID=UPI001AAC785C|nr:uncharacterized protein LOC120928699 isoform X2 [Rana temporaria]